MKGFTLIELIIVIAITGLLAVVGAVRFDGYLKDDAVDKAAYKIKYDIAYIQNRKIADTRDYKIEFDNINKSYTCFIDEDSDNIPDAGEILKDPAVKNDMNFLFSIGNTRRATVQNLNNIELESVNIYNQNGVKSESAGKTLLFIDKYGAMQVERSGIWEDISSNEQNTLIIKYGNYKRTITIYPLTTDIKIE